MKEPARTFSDTAAQVTAPVPVGISGLTFFGFAVEDWVMAGTAVLLVFQLIVIAPKAMRILWRVHGCVYKAIKGVIRHVRN